MWCTVVTRKDILPHVIQNKILEKIFSSISLKEYEKIPLLSDWAFLPPPPHTFVFVSFFSKFQQLPSLQYCLSFLSSKGFSACFFPFFPPNTLIHSKTCFPSSLRILTKCQLFYFFNYAKNLFKTWLKIVVSFCSSLHLLSPVRFMDDVQYWARVWDPSSFRVKALKLLEAIEGS